MEPGSIDRNRRSPAGGLAGTTLCGRYRLDRPIGAGGMAQVWEATDAVLGRRVAVKVLHPHLAGDAAFVRRFRQEAIAAARLNDPGIVGVYDTCTDGDLEAIVMEMLDATTLRQLIDERGVQDADTTLRISLRLLDALEAAHRAGLVHRDVKPSNILLCADGRVKVADFGIAKAEDQTELTREGTLIGTATYLAPEQLTGGEVDGRADLYALSLVLYECLTGRVPFDGDSGAAVALARLHTTPIDPRRLRADIPPRLADAIMKALAREPADRFSSAADFRAALLDTGVTLSTAPPDPPTSEQAAAAAEPSNFGRSERGWLLPALVILLVGTAVTVAGLLLRESTGTAPQRSPSTVASGGGIRPLGLTRIAAYDPQGQGRAGENDGLATLAADGDGATAWRTEAYDQSTFFGTKRGVGLEAVLSQRSRLDGLRVDGSTNGWSGAVYVIDAVTLDGFDPSRAAPVAVLNKVTGRVDVDLRGATGSIVVLWITDLGAVNDGIRHRVDIAEIVPSGVPAPG